MTTAIYVRVSTNDQDVGLQINEITSFLKEKYFSVYCDAGISGTTTKRPELQRLLGDIRAGKVQKVCVYKLDRLFRSLTELLNTLTEWEKLKVVFVSVKEQLDLSTPVGRLLIQILGSVAEFEVNLIRERVRSGMKNAQMHGTKTGRPIGAPKSIPESVKLRVASLAGTTSYRNIAKTTGVGLTTVHRVLRRK